jgi:hypothetical protein
MSDRSIWVVNHYKKIYLDDFVRNVRGEIMMGLARIQCNSVLALPLLL